ncbi:MAG: ribonuclease HII [Candidatus Micrarchaeota archaeon]|nr:ribonuclease HII [Candidatus Micrarchaeota archaeon]
MLRQGVVIIIAGGDEAGRGAVFGPLTVSIVSISKGREAKLSKVGVRDSKLLTRRKRKFLVDEIYSVAEDVKVYKIGNDEINRAMQAGMSLNELEAFNFAKLIDSLGEYPSRIYLDSPDVVSERFGVRVSLFSSLSMKVFGTKIVPRATTPEINQKRITLIAEHKADLRYPVVSCASIIAKVERDEEIDRIKDRLGIDIGSGYPSDGKTVDALKMYLRDRTVTPYIRERWKTIDIIRQQKISDFLESK